MCRENYFQYVLLLLLYFVLRGTTYTRDMNKATKAWELIESSKKQEPKRKWAITKVKSQKWMMVRDRNKAKSQHNSNTINK